MAGLQILLAEKSLDKWNNSRFLLDEPATGERKRVLMNSALQLLQKPQEQHLLLLAERIESWEFPRQIIQAARTGLQALPKSLTAGRQGLDHPTMIKLNIPSSTARPFQASASGTPPAPSQQLLQALD